MLNKTGLGFPASRLFYFSKNTKTHTPAHGGRGVFVDGNGGEEKKN